MGILKKIKTAGLNATTYRAGLLQSKAYRILKQHTSIVLSEFGISTVEWAMIGLLFDAPAGIRASTLAKELGVEASFVTQIINRLKKTGYFIITEDPTDSRAKIVSLTPEGRVFVAKTEHRLREATRPLFKGNSIGDIASYSGVLQNIIDNSSQKQVNL